ncbi:guanylate kinase [Gluconacetobacter azotocaptans]|uniref:Guanylate kinase n=1 Tax=Gluconacetobacter azotocaptans TaxID=142834 RepID=A0A7W4JRB5_9PROT|nr:guanylate kinase [Gluconacetobacter azotocaptans]MBB2189490.1 guanylate kinase [Gluconacetobacter azotocaptans]MBM9402600.1 guanylate kinase [Gluconacetobacter azotocaptans]GBQ34812.1 guanylate kinase [Gluconacetobacter azotocaptans DSM 13594]
MTPTSERQAHPARQTPARTPLGQPIARRGVCLVISAPSGAGKSTIANALRAADHRLLHSVSVTTRQPRPGETEGVHYHFRTMDQFQRMAEEGEMLEWATVFGRGYGTPRAPVEAALAAGRDMVFDIDWQGHRQIRDALPDDVVSLFVLPPSLAELERRLCNRASDHAEEIARRMKAARDEISHWREFDHVIVNTELDQAIAEARAVLVAARLETRRQAGLAGFVAGFDAAGSGA